MRVPPASAASSVVAFYDRNRAHLARWDPDRDTAFYTERFWRETLERRRAELARGNSACFTLHPIDDPDRTVGTVSLTGVVRGVFQACHLGFSLDAGLQGRGLMTEALERVLPFAFDELDLHRVMAAYQPENLRSAALLERLDFEREGFARGYLFLAGGWRDHVLTARVRGS